MTGTNELLLIMLWIPFLVWEKTSLLFIAFAGVLMYIFNALVIAQVSNTVILWYDLFLFCLLLLALVMEKKKPNQI